MLTRTNRSLVVTAFTALLLSCAGLYGTPATAQDFNLLDDPMHLDELAASLQQRANSLCWEMHRSHRQQADFAEVYRTAKQVWSRAGAVRDALRAGTTDAAMIATQTKEMDELLARVETATIGWGDGVPQGTPAASPPEERSVVVTPGAVDIDIPLLFGGGIRVGTPPRVVVTEPAQPVLPRRRLHPNAHGSKRSLERELASVRTVLNYLLEDTGVAPPDAPVSVPADAKPPIPMPPAEAGSGPTLSPPVKIVPPAAKKAGNATTKK